MSGVHYPLPCTYISQFHDLNSTHIHTQVCSNEALESLLATLNTSIVDIFTELSSTCMHRHHVLSRTCTYIHLYICCPSVYGQNSISIRRRYNRRMRVAPCYLAHQYTLQLHYTGSSYSCTQQLCIIHSTYLCCTITTQTTWIFIYMYLNINNEIHTDTHMDVNIYILYT